MLIRIKQSAKKRNIRFNLTKEDIIIPKKCPYLNIKLYPSQHKIKDHSPSLDRIDNTKGYIKGNIEVVSHLANTCKSSLSRKQLLIFAKAILAKYD